MGEEDLWLGVREAIKSNMIRCFQQHPGLVKVALSSVPTGCMGMGQNPCISSAN